MSLRQKIDEFIAMLYCYAHYDTRFWIKLEKYCDKNDSNVHMLFGIICDQIEKRTGKRQSCPHCGKPLIYSDDEY